MLQVPAFTEINGVTIYSDDTLFYKFYQVASAPHIRTDSNGDPVFLLVKYAISDEDRLADPTLPAGGGYLNFDIQFDVPDSELAEISKQLQPIVNAQWQQFRNGTAADRNRPGVAGTTAPPKVEFGTPTWTGGKVAMDAPQAKELVDARVSEAEPSLLSGNIAVFNMDLTPAGATFMQRTLTQPDGSGIDLTPIQVRYELKFWARLPSVRIHIKADSKKIHSYIQKILDGRGVDYCTTYEFQHTDLTQDSIKMTGAIEVQIDTGSGSLPDSVIDELRRYSLELVKQMIQSNFFSSQPPAKTSEGNGTIKADISGDNAKKYFKSTYNSDEMKIELDLEQRSVVEWVINPQATLQTFFQGMTADEIKKYVREIPLDDDFFKNLQLNVRAFTDFNDPNLANVEVQVHYEGTGADGQTQSKDKTFTFTGMDVQKWSPALIGGKREYLYRYRVGFKNMDAGPFTDWTSSKSTDLNISVPAPGKVDIIVLAGDVDFDMLVENVQVTLAYEDEEIGVPREEYVVKLSATRQEVCYERVILKPFRKQVQYRARWHMKSGEVREDADWQTIPGRQLVVNQSFEDLLRVSLMPVGDGWDDVVAANIELEYKDLANNYIVTPEPIMLKSKEEFKTWRVFLLDRNQRDFRYRTKISYKNGHFEDSGWLEGSGSGTYPIEARRKGLKILMLADMLDFDVCPVTEVHLKYKSAGVNLEETFKFTDKTSLTWNINVPQGAPVEYLSQVTHYPTAAPAVILEETMEHDTVMVIPPYRSPEGGKISVQVFATLVDFSATPIVTLDLYYDDVNNNVHAIGALTFDNPASQSWEVEVRDINQKQFSYVLTYYTADGVAHPMPTKAQDVPRIIIPRYNP